ncbi:MAG: flavodoxin domain-containing protein [Neobacillus sp.]
MNTAVIYKTKYGFTETYAQWIAEDLGADLLVADKVKTANLQNYSTLIYGGGLYAGGVSGIATLTKNFESIKDKTLYLFTVGAADVTDQKNIDSIRNSLSRVLTPPMMQAIKIYHFRGGMKYSKMSLIHRAMMSMMIKVVRKKPESELSAEDKMMLKTYGQDVDFTDRRMITSLIDDIKANMK